MKGLERFLGCGQSIEVPGNEPACCEKFFGIARKAGTTNETLIIGDDSADGNTTTARFALERKDSDDFSAVFDDTDFDVVAGGCNGLGKLGREARILQCGI